MIPEMHPKKGWSLSSNLVPPSLCRSQPSYEKRKITLLPGSATSSSRSFWQTWKNLYISAWCGLEYFFIKFPLDTHPMLISQLCNLVLCQLRLNPYWIPTSGLCPLTTTSVVSEYRVIRWSEFRLTHRCILNRIIRVGNLRTARLCNAYAYCCQLLTMLRSKF